MKREVKDEREPYEKPVIIHVELRPEEALATGCKTSSTAGPVTTCSAGLGCSAQGS